MPIIKKATNESWQSDEALVKDFIARLDLIIAFPQGVDVSLAVNIRAFVKERGVFSDKQSWAIAKLEERVMDADRHVHARVDWFDTPPDLETDTGYLR
jgi:hypothetical protein